MIYFIANAKRGTETTAVKVGYAKDPMKRLKQLQTGSSDNLRLVFAIDGTRDDEKRLHKRFQKYHIRGEWYRPCIEMGIIWAGSTLLSEWGNSNQIMRNNYLPSCCHHLGVPREIFEMLETAFDIQDRIRRTEY